MGWILPSECVLAYGSSSASAGPMFSESPKARSHHAKEISATPVSSRLDLVRLKRMSNRLMGISLATSARLSGAIKLDKFNETMLERPLCKVSLPLKS